MAEMDNSMLLQYDDKQHLHISLLVTCLCHQEYVWFHSGKEQQYKHYFLKCFFNMKVYGVGNVKFHDLPRNYGNEKQNTQKSVLYTKFQLYKILVFALSLLLLLFKSRWSFSAPCFFCAVSAEMFFPGSPLSNLVTLRGETKTFQDTSHAKCSNILRQM